MTTIASSTSVDQIENLPIVVAIATLLKRRAFQECRAANDEPAYFVV
jgi:hypothetical protein